MWSLEHHRLIVELLHQAAWFAAACATVSVEKQGRIIIT